MPTTEQVRISLPPSVAPVNVRVISTARTPGVSHRVRTRTAPQGAFRLKPQQPSQLEADSAGACCGPDGIATLERRVPCAGLTGRWLQDYTLEWSRINQRLGRH